MRHVLHQTFTRAARPPRIEDRITADLRSFALEIGMPGAGGMSKNELVEGLRQFHVLRHTLESATAPWARRTVEDAR